MRKTFKIIPIVLILIISTACNKASTTPDITQGFSAVAEISYEDFKGSANITKVGQGVWTLEFTSPDTVKGMKTDFSNGDVSFSLDGISFDVSGEDSQVTTIAETIFSAIDELSGNNETLTAEQNDSQIIVKFEKDDKSHILTFDKQTKALKTLNIPKDDLSVMFTDYKTNA